LRYCLSCRSDNYTAKPQSCQLSNNYRKRPRQL